MALLMAFWYASWLWKSFWQKVWLPPCTGSMQVVQGTEVQVSGHGAPQSIPASPWFCIPSVQVGQGPLHWPPQSIPVSSWFCTPSKQVGSNSPILRPQATNNSNAIRQRNIGCWVIMFCFYRSLSASRTNLSSFIMPRCPSHCNIRATMAMAVTGSKST